MQAACMRMSSRKHHVMPSLMGRKSAASGFEVFCDRLSWNSLSQKYQLLNGYWQPCKVSMPWHKTAQWRQREIFIRLSVVGVLLIVDLREDWRLWYLQWSMQTTEKNIGLNRYFWKLDMCGKPKDGSETVLKKNRSEPTEAVRDYKKKNRTGPDLKNPSVHAYWVWVHRAHRAIQANTNDLIVATKSRCDKRDTK